MQKTIMPCVCDQKVDRNLPKEQKVQCAKCNDLFHATCVGIRPADVEFLQSAGQCFFCEACTILRRTSLRSPPPPITKEKTSTVITSSSSSNSPKSGDSTKHSDNSLINAESQQTINSLFNLIASLQTENASVLKSVSALNEANNNLVLESTKIYSALQSIQSKLADKDKIIAALTSEVKSLRVSFNAAFDKLRVNSETNYSSMPVNSMSTCASSAPSFVGALSYAHIISSNMSTDSNNIPTITTMGCPMQSTASCTVTSAITDVISVFALPSSSTADANACALKDKANACAASTTATVTAAPVSEASASPLLPVFGNDNAQWVKVSNKRARKNSNKNACGTATTTTTTTSTTAVTAAPASDAAASSHMPIDVTNNVTGNAQWVKVSHKRHNNNNNIRIRGTSDNTDLIVADRYKLLHLASFSPSVSEDDIKNYVAKQIDLDRTLISCSKLIKKDVSAQSLNRINFKLGVPESCYEKLLCPDIWPTNVTVKPFLNFRKGRRKLLRT
ncbi:nuclear pore complex protein NUP62-like [Rhagoletis pomonella]|uniref:nuclear pore complex protein NUP62-like n=2 Tax=Rhagoletis pomonella TaxID=28610 RepID=UPI00178490C2|nr:nuclear pore complex protein NUP62-like [Rhagoletis pomonella]